MGDCAMRTLFTFNDIFSINSASSIYSSDEPTTQPDVGCHTKRHLSNNSHVYRGKESLSASNTIESPSQESLQRLARAILESGNASFQKDRDGDLIVRLGNQHTPDAYTRI